jgi:hypothetical protein
MKPHEFESPKTKMRRLSVFIQQVFSKSTCQPAERLMPIGEHLARLENSIRSRLFFLWRGAL